MLPTRYSAIDSHPEGSGEVVIALGHARPGSYQAERVELLSSGAAASFARYHSLLVNILGTPLPIPASTCGCRALRWVG